MSFRTTVSTGECIRSKTHVNISLVELLSLHCIHLDRSCRFASKPPGTVFLFADYSRWPSAKVFYVYLIAVGRPKAAKFGASLLKAELLVSCVDFLLKPLANYFPPANFPFWSTHVFESLDSKLQSNHPKVSLIHQSWWLRLEKNSVTILVQLFSFWSKCLYL